MRRSERIKKNKPVVPIKKSAKAKKAAKKGDVIPVEKAKRGGFYDTQYKKLLIIPFVLLILAFVSIGIQFATTGEAFYKGVSLSGGLLVTIPTEMNVDTLVSEMSSLYPQQDIEGRTLEESGSQVAVTIITDISAEQKTEVNNFILSLEEKTGVSYDDFSIETIGSSLGASFFEQTTKALFMAFLFMGFVVFLYFGKGWKEKVTAGVLTVASGFLSTGGSFTMILALLIAAVLMFLYARFSIPSVAVMLAAFSDIVVTLAIVNLFGIKLSTAGIAAFLMLIGYSVDTDILLSTRVLKRQGGSVFDRVIGALKTGLTMNATTLASVGVALIFAQSEIITQIMTILLIGLLVDMINTWLQNVGILRWFLEKKDSKGDA